MVTLRGALKPVSPAIKATSAFRVGARTLSMSYPVSAVAFQYTNVAMVLFLVVGYRAGQGQSMT